MIPVADIDHQTTSSRSDTLTRPRRRSPSLTPLALIVTIIAGAALVVAGTMWTSTPTVTESTTSASSGGDVAGEASSVQLVDVSDVAAEVVDSVVTVDVAIDVRGRGELTGSGSGIVLDDDGTIVTNAHVVEDATRVTVTLADGTTADATVVGIDSAQDLAVLDIDATGLSPISLGTTDGLAVGDPVIAVGNPLGLDGGPSVTTGIVSALGRVLEESDVSLQGVIQTDAAITEGSSGGALLDGEGRLIGVTTAVGVSSVGVEGIGFAIPVETVTTVVAAIATGSTA